MSNDTLHRTINMVSQNTATDTFLKYFTDDTPVVKEKFVSNQLVIEKNNW